MRGGHPCFRHSLDSASPSSPPANVHGVATGDVDAGQRTVHLNPGTRISGECRLRFPDDPGHDWVIVGLPIPNQSPTGRLSHIAVITKRWEAAQ